MQSAVAEMKGNMTMKAFKEDLGDISYSSISWNIIVELEQKLNNRMQEERNFLVSVMRNIGKVLTELAVFVVAVVVVVVGKVRMEHQ